MDPKSLKSSEFYYRRYHNFTTLITFPSACLFVFLILFSLIAKKEVTFVTAGEVSPLRVIDTIQSPSHAPIINNRMTDSRFVKKGELLLQYEDRVVTAKENAIMEVNSKYAGAGFIPEGEVIAKLYPDIKQVRKVLVTYYADSAKVVYLKKGQKVRLFFAKTGNNQVALSGKISTIFVSAIGTNKGNLFKITASADIPIDYRSLIKYGLRGRVVSIIAKKTYFDYYKDKLLGQG
ncbi:HlyD family efflux transporter periplasmic adaptor subunit [Streptococcus ferus]|uniref:HlyD family efflux transporter periplasmic adaptor subunit n=1 Tax=Streptococcus ferus TaxID=1345 RepID=UPI0023552366|nr:HlyD family efflux transporter periplasmic adaptor subunit [Streptococcus ferus]